MKTFCSTCVIHFEDEFEQTLKPPCNYWGAIGLSNLPRSLKKKIWKWIFMLPIDEMAVKYKIGFQFSYGTGPVSIENEFIHLILGYEQMSEPEKKQAQREYIGNKQKLEREKQAQIGGGGEGTQPQINKMPPRKVMGVN